MFLSKTGEQIRYMKLSERSFDHYCLLLVYHYIHNAMTIMVLLMKITGQQPCKSTLFNVLSVADLSDMCFNSLYTADIIEIIEYQFLKVIPCLVTTVSIERHR